MKARRRLDRQADDYPDCLCMICKPSPEGPSQLPAAIKGLDEFAPLGRSQAVWLKVSQGLNSPIRVWCSNVAGWHAMLVVGRELMNELRQLPLDDRRTLADQPGWREADKVIAGLVAASPPATKPSRAKGRTREPEKAGPTPPELRHLWLTDAWIRLVVAILVSDTSADCLMQMWTINDGKPARTESPDADAWWSKPMPVADAFKAVVDALLQPLAPAPSEAEWSEFMTLKEIGAILGCEGRQRAIRSVLGSVTSSLQATGNKQRWRVRLKGMDPTYVNKFCRP